jgi:multidrug transporter EmrE-like cation transporter
VTETTPRHRRRSLILVLCCTVIGAAAQILIKMGAGALNEPNPTLLQTAMHMITTPSLLAGYSMYGVSTVLLIAALKHGELSLLYPVFAMTYVWVTILSVVVFHESLNPYKLTGIVIIVGGVAVLGLGDRR